MVLSKSEYMMFLKHPAWLWLKKHDKKKLPPPDANLQAIFDAGIEFEQYANKRFPNGIEVGFNNYTEYLSMPARTEKALSGGGRTIFQGRFEANGITCICDIVDVVGEKTLDLYEIKSSTKVKKEHYFDLAFQVVVLESSGFTVRDIFVIHVNGEYIRNGDVKPLELSTSISVKDEVHKEIEQTKYNIKTAFTTIALPEMPDISPRHTSLGSLREWMDIYKNLTEVDHYSIYNLIAPGVKRLGDLEDMGVTHIKNIPDGFKLTSKQQAQVEATKKNERIIKIKKIQEFLRSAIYPLYFLDYETAMGVIPPYNGTKPYQQIPFQYSLHIINKPGEDPIHKEYLHKGNNNPVPQLLSALKEGFGTKGSVIVWYKSFEISRNEEMAEMMPEYKDFLEDINDRILDLIEPFSKGWVVDKEFLGSASIKAVLPVLVPDLSYKDLDIKEGASAQRLWMDRVLKEKGAIDKEDLFSALIEYCKMDTLAMVKVWQFLEKTVEAT